LFFGGAAAGILDRPTSHAPPKTNKKKWWFCAVL
jgi:hypothetical protein